MKEHNLIRHAWLINRSLPFRWPAQRQPPCSFVSESHQERDVTVHRFPKHSESHHERDLAAFLRLREPPDRHVADWLRLREPQGERCRRLPSSTRVTDTKDADFLYRQEPQRDTAFRWRAPPKDSRIAFSPRRGDNRREKKKRRDETEATRTPLLSPIDGWHVALKRRPFSALIRRRLLANSLFFYFF